MVCEAKEGVVFYRPRKPQQTPFYQLVERFYQEFKAVYEECCQAHEKDIQDYPLADDFPSQQVFVTNLINHHLFTEHQDYTKSAKSQDPDIPSADHMRFTDEVCHPRE